MELRNWYMIIKENFKINIKHSVIVALVIIFIIPFIYGTANLNEIKVAECMEKMVVLIGIPLFVPIVKPEQEFSIREIILIKRFPYRITVLLRIIMAVILSTVFIYGFEVYILYKGCSFPFYVYLLRTVIATMLIGGFGILVSVLSGNTLIGYLVAFLCFFLTQFKVPGLEMTIVSQGVSIWYVLIITFLYLIILTQCESKK